MESILIGAGVFGMVLTFLLPSRFGLALALVYFMLIPRPLYAESQLLGTFPPAYFVLVAWFVRAMGRSNRIGSVGDRRPFPGMLGLLVVTLAWFSITSVWSISITTSASWLVPFAFGVVFLFAYARDREESLAALRAVWVAAACIMAVYAFAEFALARNPIYDALYASVSRPLEQKWAVYRIHASFGHPLYAALFFTLSAALAYGFGIMRGSKRYIFAGLLCGVAAAFTFSRAGIVTVSAVLVAQTVIAIFARTRIRFFGKLGLAAVLSFGVFGIFQIPQVQERFLSREAEDSTASRGGVDAVAQAASQAYSYLGSGIGTSAASARPYNPENLLIENGYYQLLISSGIVGMVLFGLIMAAMLVFSLRRMNIAGAGVVAAFAVMIGTFNALESNPGICLLLGMVILMVFAPVAEPVASEPIVGSGTALLSRPIVGERGSSVRGTPSARRTPSRSF